MPKYNHRGHIISISFTRFDDKVKIETEILLPSSANEGNGH